MCARSLTASALHRALWIVSAFMIRRLSVPGPDTLIILVTGNAACIHGRSWHVERGARPPSR
jgi:hypothetical protein